MEDEADRLEAALERIARATAGRAGPAAPPRGLPSTDAEELAARLDALIADLRAALNGTA